MVVPKFETNSDALHGTVEQPLRLTAWSLTNPWTKMSLVAADCPSMTTSYKVNSNITVEDGPSGRR